MAEPLAYVSGDLEDAQALRQQISGLHTSDAERLADPFRPWRLELDADRPALKRWQAIRRLPAGAGRLQALADALQERPDATVLAFGLLHTLRQAGAVGETAFTPLAGARIPRRLWLLRRPPGGSPEEGERQGRWLDLHPGWSCEWLDPEREAISGRRDLPRPVQLACQAVNCPEVRSDLLRLALLWQHGGLSVTWDSRPQRSLEPLVEPGTGLLLSTDSLGGLGLDAIAAAPRHPFVQAALEGACRRVLQGEGFSRWELSGACLLSGCLARWLAPGLGPARSSATPLPAGVRLLSWGELQGWLSLGIPLPRPQEAPEEPAWIELIDERRRRMALRTLENRGEEAPVPR
jgi:hypothetical protein